MREALISSFAALLVIAVMIVQGLNVEPALCELSNVRLRDLPGYTSQVIEPSEREVEILPSDTTFDKRIYTAEDGSWFSVSFVTSGRSKGSLHRPEICLPSQGFQMTKPHTIEVNGVSWRNLTLERGAHGSLGFAYSFFNQAGFRTSSHVRRILQDIFDRCFLTRIDRWTMVSVNASQADEVAFRRFLHQLAEVIK